MCGLKRRRAGNAGDDVGAVQEHAPSFDVSSSAQMVVRPDSLHFANDSWMKQISIAGTEALPRFPPVELPHAAIPAPLDVYSPPPNISGAPSQSEEESSLHAYPAVKFTSAEPATHLLGSVVDRQAALSHVSQPEQLLPAPSSTTQASSKDKLANSDPVPVQTLASPHILNTHLQSSKVPSSRLGRLFHYGGMW